MSQSTIEQEVAKLELSPTVHEHVVVLLSTYNDLRFDRDALQHQMDIESMAISNILAEAGITKAKIDGMNLEWHRGETTKKLLVEKLLAQGVTLAQIENATINQPKKDYFKIVPPRAKAESDED